MIEPRYWQKMYLMVTVQFEGHSNTFLLNRVPQVQFVGRYSPGSRKFVITTIVVLDEESFEVLEPLYQRAGNLMEGD